MLIKVVRVGRFFASEVINCKINRANQRTLIMKVYSKLAMFGLCFMGFGLQVGSGVSLDQGVLMELECQMALEEDAFAGPFIRPVPRVAPREGTRPVPPRTLIPRRLRFIEPRLQPTCLAGEDVSVIEQP